jgi:hypothetical protein
MTASSTPVGSSTELDHATEPSFEATELSPELADCDRRRPSSRCKRKAPFRDDGGGNRNTSLAASTPWKGVASAAASAASMTLRPNAGSTSGSQ